MEGLATNKAIVRDRSDGSNLLEVCYLNLVKRGLKGLHAVSHWSLKQHSGLNRPNSCWCFKSREAIIFMFGSH